MPGDCGHQALLHICGDDKHPLLTETHRFHDIVHALPTPTSQYPSFLFFLGGQTKSEALRHLFPLNRLKSAPQEDVARIHIDGTTVKHRYPVLFADAELTFHLRQGNGTGCHSESMMPVSWAASVDDIQAVFDHVVARGLLATANIVILFVNDFEDLEQVSQSLHRWTSIGVMSDSPPESRPRLVLVVKDRTYTGEDIRNLYVQLELHRLTKLFSLVSTVYLHQDDQNPHGAYQRLKTHIGRESRLIREKLVTACWSFNALHIEKLFRLRLQHVANTQLDDFHTLYASRQPHLGTHDDKIAHLSEAIEYGQQRLVSYQSTASLIASALVMDAVPTGSHCE